MERFLKQLAGALLLAVLLWLTFVFTFAQPVVFRIPVQPIGLASDLAVSDVLPQVSVLVRGFGVEPASLSAEIDLKKMRFVSGLEVPISVRGEKGRVLAYTPSKLRVSVVPILMQERELSFEIEKFPPAGFAIKDLTLDPKTVEVSGSEQLLRRAAKIIVPINLSWHRSRSVFQAPVEAIDSQGKGLSGLVFSPPQVTVVAEIAPGEDLKSVVIEPVFNGELSAGINLKEVIVTPKVATLRGDLKTLEQIVSLKTTPIGLKGKIETFTEEVGLEIPALVAVSTKLAKVEVRLEVAVTSRIFKLVPGFVNLAQSLSVLETKPSLITVALSGPSNLLAGLADRDVRLKVDLTGLISGIQTVQLKAEMVERPLGLTVVGFEPDEVTVMLKRREQVGR